MQRVLQGSEQLLPGSQSLSLSLVDFKVMSEQAAPVPEEQEIDICNIESFNKVIQDNERVAIAVTQEGCDYCPTYSEILEKVGKDIGEKTPILELDLKGKEDPCNEVADKLEVTETPTTILFIDGKEVGRFLPSGDKVKDEEDLRKFVTQEPPPQEVVSPPPGQPA